MASGYESLITLYENAGWYDVGTLNPLIPVLSAEGLDPGLMASERSSMARNTRAQEIDSYIVDYEYKPSGFIEIIPRLENLTTIFMSHFQVIDSVATGSSYLNTYVPAKTTPNYTGADLYGTGTYGVAVQDVYSIDIRKKVINVPSDHQTFQKGLCDTLTLNQQAGEDFKVRADFQFKEWTGTHADYSFGDASAGSYTSGTLTDWSHGTWSLAFDAGGTTITEISGINVECSNNLTEKKVAGALSRKFFNFGNYTVKGKFSTEYESDPWYRTWQGTSFSITGTIFHTNIDYMTVSMPNCKLKPFNRALVNPEEFIDAEVDFEAFESAGTSPITVTLHTTQATPTLEGTNWDAAFGARTLSEYDFADAGSTTRTLSEYDFADRDF